MFRNPEAYKTASETHIKSLKNYIESELKKDPESVSFDACSYTDEDAQVISTRVYGFGSFWTKHNPWGGKVEQHFEYIH